MLLVGHKAFKTDGGFWGWFRKGYGIHGIMMKLDQAGALQWTKEIGNYPGGVNQFYDLPVGDW